MKKINAGGFAWGFVLLITLFSCGTAKKSGQAVPDKKEIAKTLFESVPEGGSFYLFCRPQAAESLLTEALPQLFDNSGTEKFLAKTDFAAAALYSGTGRTFFAAAKGSYPVSGIDFAFAFDPGWKRARDSAGNKYWKQKNGPMSIAVTKTAAFVGDGDFGALDGGINLKKTFVRVPDYILDALEFSGLTPVGDSFIMAGWTEDIGPLNNYLAGLNIPIKLPIKALVFSLFELGNGFSGCQFRMVTGNSRQAKAVTAMFALVRPIAEQVDVPKESGALFTVLFGSELTQNGDTVLFTSRPLDDRTVSLLIQNFMVY
jgi:hypothetical protein